MKLIIFILMVSLNLFAQENLLQKSCDTTFLNRYQISEFENADFKTGLINNGVYFISSISELKSFLKTSKKNTFIENKGNQIINVDFSQFNLLLFSGFFGGVPGNPPLHQFKSYFYNNKYTFQLIIYYSNPISMAMVPIYHYFLIPKNISKCDISFYICERY